MLKTIITIVVPLLKWLFERAAKKKITDKEFIAHILAHQSKLSNSGDVALDANKILEDAMKEQ